MSEPKTGPELALLRVKRKQRKMRRDIDKMNKQAQVQEENRIEASLIGELKAAQSNNRNAKMKDTERKFYDSIGLRSHLCGAHRDYREPAKRPFGTTIGSIIAGPDPGKKNASKGSKRS